MKRQAEFDELKKQHRQYPDPQKPAAKEIFGKIIALAEFKPGERVRYKGDTFQVADVSSFDTELRYTLYAVDKQGYTKTKSRTWYVKEEELELFGKA